MCHAFMQHCSIFLLRLITVNLVVCAAVLCLFHTSTHIQTHSCACMYTCSLTQPTAFCGITQWPLFLFIANTLLSSHVFVALKQHCNALNRLRQCMRVCVCWCASVFVLNINRSRFKITFSPNLKCMKFSVGWSTKQATPSHPHTRTHICERTLIPGSYLFAVSAGCSFSSQRLRLLCCILAICR